MLDGTIDGYESYETAVADAVAPSRSTSRDRRHRHAVLVGHDRPTEGRRAPVQGDADRRSGLRRARAVASCCSASTTRRSTSRRRPSTTPLRCASASPRRPSAAPSWRWSTSTPSSTSRSIEQLPRDAQPGRADDVHPHAQAARGRAREVRRVVAGVRDPRGRAVPGAGQEADDRVVRPGDPRVLRRHRGQRLRLLQQRDVARPRGHGRHADRMHRAHRRRGRRGTPARASRAPSTSRAARRSSTTTIRRRRRGRGTRRDGRRSATSAISTPTTSCTSPTARRT